MLITFSEQYFEFVLFQSIFVSDGSGDNTRCRRIKREPCENQGQYPLLYVLIPEKDHDL